MWLQTATAWVMASGRTSTDGARRWWITSPSLSLSRAIRLPERPSRKSTKAHRGAEPAKASSPVLLSLRFLLLRLQRLGAEEEPRDNSAKTRNKQEEPHLRQCLAADQQRRSQAARGIHAHARNADAEDVNRDQRDADGQPRKSCRRALLSRAEDDDDEDQRRNKLKSNCGGHVVPTLIAG